MKKDFNYNGTTYDSTEEIEFAMWIEEATASGFILAAKYQPDSFILTERKTIPEVIQLKTKTKTIEKFFMNPLTYQADWELIFTNKFFAVFPDHGLITFKHSYFVDVKGSYSFQDAYRRLSIYQKLVFDKYDIFVNMLVPENRKAGNKIIPGFFSKTFCPAGAYFMKNRRVLTARKNYASCKLLREIK